LGEVQAAAQAIGQRLIIANASREHDMAAAFAALVDQRVGALAALAATREELPPSRNGLALNVTSFFETLPKRGQELRVRVG
jgi:hypothetical protein